MLRANDTERNLGESYRRISLYSGECLANCFAGFGDGDVEKMVELTAWQGCDVIEIKGRVM